MSQYTFPPQFATGLQPAGSERTLLRDIIWDRPIFRAPTLSLPNPRVVFDPPPFRTQIFHTARRVYRFARG